MQFISPSRFRPGAVRKAITALFLAGMLLGGLGYLAEATPLSQLADDGQALFQQKCAACHTLGGGKTAGPDLKMVTKTRDKEWLEHFILAPDKMIADKDPIAIQLLNEYKMPMPNLGLTEVQVDAIWTFLDTQAGGSPASQPAKAPAPAQPQPGGAIAGDPAAGQSLFTGAIGLRNGGAPCLSCHGIGSTGAIGGGALGPDLTPTYSKYGDSGMASLLASLPFPTMQPIYGAHPLTPEEQANIKAFLQASGAQQPANGTWLVALLAVACLVAFLVLAQVVWRRKLQSVRGALVQQSRARGGFGR